jgi:hypothetical protein
MMIKIAYLRKTNINVLIMSGPKLLIMNTTISFDEIAIL